MGQDSIFISDRFRQLFRKPFLSMKKQLLLLFLLCFIALRADENSGSSSSSDLLGQREKWVNRSYASLNLDEKIGQLFMLRAHSDKGKAYEDRVEQLIKTYKVGGLCFFQGTPERQTELTNRYQAASKIPLMISMDAEWGLGMRLTSSTISFPKQLMLGAITDNRLIYQMGQSIARQCKRIGVHINFAPVADVNNNPANPVIGMRSFGEDRYNVAVKSYMYAQGMQDAGVMACAKHFPGHGDTNLDSHYDLPVIPHTSDRLDSIELFPFKILSEHGIQSMMVAHLSVPALDGRNNRPTSLSKPTIAGLLQDSLEFEGLIFTDGLEMKGVTKHFNPGVVEAEALVAGNDILLLPEDVGKALESIKMYLEQGKISETALEQKVKKVLRAKYNLGLTDFTPMSTIGMRDYLHDAKTKALNRKLIQNAITAVRDEQEILPIEDIREQNVATLAMGAYAITPFQKMVDNYMPVEHLFGGKLLEGGEMRRKMDRLKDKDLVIVSIHDMNNSAGKNFGVTMGQRSFLQALAKNTKVLLVIFGNPYSLAYFDQIPNVVVAYNDGDLIQELTAQGIFGVFPFKGRLPITASVKSKYRSGMDTRMGFRLGYVSPELVGLNKDNLSTIDGLMADAIEKKATPGGTVLIVKDGQVAYHKAFGHHTYSKRRKLQKNDIFDVASITKVASTTLAIMRLYENGQINIYDPIGKYLPELKGTNKEHLVIRNILCHKAGLRAWIPFFESTIVGSKRNPKPDPKLYKRQKTKGFEIQITDNLWLRNDYRDTIWQKIYDSELRSSRDYRYSDLGFYLMSKLVYQVSAQPLDEYVKRYFYEPLGLRSTTYKPSGQFDNSQIVPSEEDKYWRRQRIDGHVHDMGAAMLGGVSGHAGLFSTANDLAVLMQMLLNDGYYGGKRFLKAETIRQFINRHPEDTRRAVGFDMKELDINRTANMSTLASDYTFGHLGFTGTCVWADPKYDLIYVFLSNRTYPSMKNFKLNSEDYRPRIQRVLYESLNK